MQVRQFVRSGSALYLGIFLLASCATSDHSVIESAKGGSAPIDFECRDGVRFSISFNKKTDTASLMFNGHSTPEILDDSKLASGIEYANDDYAFREHQSVTKLVDLTQDDAVETTCRRIVKSKAPN